MVDEMVDGERSVNGTQSNPIAHVLFRPFSDRSQTESVFIKILSIW